MKAAIPDDVIVLPGPRGRWILYNAFTRTSVVVDSRGLEVLAGTAESEASVWRIWKFSNAEGLLCDPTNLIRDAKDWPAEERLDAASLRGLALELCLLVEDKEAYRRRFAAKTSLLDAEHWGNFHQQLGQELMLNRRQNPETWWANQKFEPDFKSIRDNLYRAVQYHFLRGYFPSRFPKGASVVDVGCGVGFYSSLMASGGSRVLGVDPSKNYVDIARKNAAPGARFEVMNVGAEGGLDGVPAASADFVFMSDALLFYFVPAALTQQADIAVLLADIRRILKPGGVFISLEPSFFWLSPWLGDPDRPFTVLTEYREKRFGVTPSLGQMAAAFCDHGFAVSALKELRPDPAFMKTDPRGWHFAEQFPLWHLFELTAKVR